MEMIRNLVELSKVDSVEKYLSTLSKMHIEAVPEDYLSLLGKFFLKNVFYKEAIKSDNVNIIVHLESGILGGYIIYSYDTGKFIREIVLRRLLLVVIILIQKILLNYRILAKSIEVGLSIIKDRTETNKSEILMIVVKSNYRGKGIGQKLLESMYMDLKNKNINVCKLRVLINNLAAIKMYEKSGWEKSNEIEFLGRTWIGMKKDIIEK